MANSVITLDNVFFRYPDAGRDALSGVSLSIEAGSFIAVLGHNGSGKSTLAKLLNAILVPTEGTVTVKGMDTRSEENLLNVRRTVGMVFQNPDNQIVASVVEDDVAFAPENLGVSPAEIRRRVDEALKRVGMYEFRNNAPHLLSGGQKQRVAIAGVLAMQPEILVMDEPTAMLDPSGRQEVLRTIADLRAATGVTVVLITHHMDECIDADRLLVVSDGKLVLDGAPKDVFSRVEQMRSIGLDVPATTETLYELRAAGADVPLGALSDAEAADAQIVEALQAAGAEYIVMAGYMRKVTPVMLRAFPNRVLNLHPALLPSFKGAHAIRDAFEAGVKVTGVTVHFDNEDYDKGPIVAQRAVEVAENDTLETLEAKIHEVEHVLYPQAVQLIAEGRVSVDEESGRVHIK